VSEQNADYERITVVSADDWAAIYVDGKLLEQGHSVREDTLLELLVRAGIQVFDYSERPECYAMCDEVGAFPDTDDWIHIARSEP
jgi:hypothetical protein